jgi:opacity protein-like surface antigen
MGENSIVHEASVWIPLGGLDTKLFAGQIPDWSGYEYYAPNMYKNITHNLLFDFTLPSSYTGFGIEVIRGKLDLKLMLANMNSSVRNIGEKVPMFVFRGDYGVSEYWGFGFAGAAGYKTNLRSQGDVTADPALDGKDSLYTTLELDGWYTRADLTFNAHVTYGSQKKAAVTADLDTGALRDSQWVGLSVLGAYKFTQRLEGVLRGDFIYNQKNGGGLLDYVVPDPINGIGPSLDPAADPNKGANRYAVTAGLDYALNSNVILKFEYRYDGADLAVFGKKATQQEYLANQAPVPDDTFKYTKNNSTIATSVVLFF